MTLHHVAVAAKDGQATPVAIPGGIRQHDVSGTGAGPNVPELVITDSTGAEVLGTTADPAVTTDIGGSAIGFLRGLVKLIAAGINVVITNANANITAIAGGTVAAGTAGAPVVGADQYGAYKAAAASATTLLGATGAVGDYLAGVIIVPGTAAAGTVGVTDGNGSAISLFAGGGTTALPSLAPFFVPLGIFATGATTPGWRLILGANVTAIGVGKFT